MVFISYNISTLALPAILDVSPLVVSKIWNGLHIVAFDSRSRTAWVEQLGYGPVHNEYQEKINTKNPSIQYIEIKSAINDLLTAGAILS